MTTVCQPVPSALRRPRVRRAARQLIRELAALAAFWYMRQRSRRALAGLDARLLDDVGLSRDEAAREAAKPFWRD